MADHRAALARAARLRSALPYCGPCYEADQEINDLVPIKLWRGDGRPTTGHYCPCCGVEFDE